MYYIFDSILELEENIKPHNLNNNKYVIVVLDMYTFYMIFISQ